MDGVQIDRRQLRAGGAAGRVALGQAPAAWVVAANIAQHAGARRHAVDELLREPVELRRGNAQGTQPRERQREIAVGRRAVVGVGRGGDLERRQGLERSVGVDDAQQDQATPRDLGIGLQNAALHVLGDDAWQARRLGDLSLARLLEPREHARESPANRRFEIRLRQRVGLHLAKNVVRRAQQNAVFFRRVAGEDRRQREQRRHRAQCRERDCGWVGEGRRDRRRQRG